MTSQKTLPVKLASRDTHPPFKIQKTLPTKNTLQETPTTSSRSGVVLKETTELEVIPTSRQRKPPFELRLALGLELRLGAWS